MRLLNAGATSSGGATMYIGFDAESSASLPVGMDYNCTGDIWGFNSSGYAAKTTSGNPNWSYDPTGTTMQGIVLANDATNYVLHNRDFSNAAWTKTNMSASKNATGLDNVANSASTLTADAANATVEQDITDNSQGTDVFRVWMKRKTGTGTVRISCDDGVSWTDVTSSINSSTYTCVVHWKFFTSAHICVIEIQTSGDEVEVDFADYTNQDVTGDYFHPIETTTAAVTQSVAHLDFDSDDSAPLENSIVIHLTRFNSVYGGSVWLKQNDIGGTAWTHGLGTASGSMFADINQSGVLASESFSQAESGDFGYAMQYFKDDFQYSKDGATKKTDTTCTWTGSATNRHHNISASQWDANQTNCHVQLFEMWDSTINVETRSVYGNKP